MSLRIRALVFALFLAVAAMGNITQFSMNAMLPAINADLAIDGTMSQWLATAYIMTVGIFVPIAPFLFKSLGPKKTLIVAAFILLAGSLLDCMAQSFGLIFLGRLMQAAATGITTPIMQTIAVAWFPDHVRGRMLGITGVVMGFAGAFGPTAGGFLCEFYGWRSYFVILSALAAVAFAVAVFSPKLDLDKAENNAPDVLSLVLSTFSFSLILLGFSNAATYPLTSVEVLVPTVVGGVLLVCFIVRQRHLEHPIIQMGIFRSESYCWGFGALCGASLSFMGTSLSIPLYVQGCLGASAADAALVMLPAALTTIVINYVSGSIVDHFGEKPASFGFGTIFLVSSFVALTYSADTSLMYVTVTHAIRSVGMAGIIAPMLNHALGGLDKSIMPDGSSFMVVCRQVSAAIGTSAMASAILAVPGTVNAAFPYWVSFLISALGALFVFACIFGGMRKVGKK